MVRGCVSDKHARQRKIGGRSRVVMQRHHIDTERHSSVYKVSGRTHSDTVKMLTLHPVTLTQQWRAAIRARIIERIYKNTMGHVRDVRATTLRGNDHIMVSGERRSPLE